MANYNAPITEGGTLSMGYTGTYDTINILKTGLYCLDVRGAGTPINGTSNYRNGGRSYGYKLLKKGTVLHACIGGAGRLAGNTSYIPGGFNGGGSARSYPYNNGDGWSGVGCSAAGATHIALISGTLQNIGASRKNQVLIVAGGAGAGNNSYPNNGLGGGTSGGDGIAPSGTSGGRIPTGGTQSSAGYDDHKNNNISGGFGFGGYYPWGGDNWVCSGGGGGLYGGGSSIGWQNPRGPSGGGSGYIGGVPAITYKGKTYSPSTITGSGNSGNGSIIITLVKKGTPTLYYGDKEVDALYYGDKEVDAMYYGDKEVG